MIGTIFNAKELSKKPKATVQLTGKLGFNMDAIDLLGIAQQQAVLLAPDDQNKRVLYMALIPETTDMAFPILKSGPYYYLNTKQLFDMLKIDYQANLAIFDISREEIGDEVMGGICYKMVMRVKPRTSDAEEE